MGSWQKSYWRLPVGRERERAKKKLTGKKKFLQIWTRYPGPLLDVPFSDPVASGATHPNPTPSRNLVFLVRFCAGNTNLQGSEAALQGGRPPASTDRWGGQAACGLQACSTCRRALQQWHKSACCPGQVVVPRALQWFFLVRPPARRLRNSTSLSQNAPEMH